MDLRDAIQAKKQDQAQFAERRILGRGNLVKRDGSVEVTGEGLLNHVWVLPNGEGEPVAILNRRVKKTRPNLKVVYGFEAGSTVLEILHTDIESIAGIEDIEGLDMQNHAASHRWDGDDPVPVVRRSITEMLYVSTGSGVSINVSSYDYHVGTTLVSFAGYQNYSLSSAKPASGLARFVLIYLNTLTNTLGTVNGSTVVDNPTITPTKPPAPAEAIPLAFVRLDGDITQIAQIDILPGREFLNVVPIKHNLSAMTDPTTGDDEDDGYSKKSLWFNTTSGDIFICADPSAGAAVWDQINGGGNATAPAYGQIVVLDSAGGAAQYASLAAAAAGISGSNNVILIGPGASGTFPADEVDFSGVLAIIGAGVDVTNITTSTDSFYTFSVGTGRIYNMTIVNTSSKATRIYGIKSGSTSVRLENVKIRTNNTGAGASTCLDSFGTTIINPDFQAQSTTGTDDIGLMAYDDITVHGGVIEARGNGASVDEDSVFGGVVTLVNAPKLIDETGAPESIENGGSMEGQYIDGDGNLITLDDQGFNAGVWLLDESANLRIKKTSITTAHTAAAASDVIEVEPGTYSTYPTITKAITLRGVGGPERAILDSGSLLVQAAAVIENIHRQTDSSAFSTNTSGGAIFRKCTGTVSSGGASRAGGSFSVDTTLEQCEFTVSGGATANYGVALNSSNTVTIRGGRFSGTTADLWSSGGGGTYVLEGPTLANGTLDLNGDSWVGWYYDETNQVIVISPGNSARVYNSANESINDSTLTALTFNSERFDTNSIHSTSSNTSRLTAQVDGKYLISASVRFAANSTGKRQASLRLSGGSYIASQNFPAAASGSTDITLSTIYSMTASQYVEVEVYQDSGGPLNVNATGNLSPEFSIARLPG